MKKYLSINGFQLKLLGITFMVCDHIHQMFYYTENLTWLNMIGRMTLPIFLFMAAEGFYYTKSKKKYMLRLYVAGILMQFVSIFIEKAFPITQHPIILMNNVFFTMLLSTIAMLSINYLRQKKIFTGIALFLLPVLSFSIYLLILITKTKALIALVYFLPSYFSIEGGLIAVLIATGFYIFRDNRKYQYLSFFILTVINTVFMPGFSITELFSGHNNQWMMIFSILFISLYNGQKGNGHKYFFYFFYPFHIYGLYFLARFLLQSGILS